MNYKACSNGTHSRMLMGEVTAAVKKFTRSI
jgi:hypothetical protein